MNTKNEAIVQSLIEKRTEEEIETIQEEAKEFKPGQYEISQEMSLILENLALKLEIIERDKNEIEAARHVMIAQIAKELGVPDDMKIVGGTSDFKKVVIEKRNKED